MANIIMPSYTLPLLVKLEGNRHNLYYHQVETKKDLVDIVRHLTTVVGLNPTAQCKVSEVFEVNGQLYYLQVSADGNPSGEYFIERTLYKCICDNTSELVSWFTQYNLKANKHLHFDDIWEVIHPEPLYLRCPRSSIDGRFIPEGINAGYNHYLFNLSRIEVFANLLAQLKD